MSKGMCWAASVVMPSASSASLIGVTLIGFTITECPLTDVATLLVLMLCWLKILLMALETCPESTIMESTTTSLARGSKPECATTTSPLDRFSSIALMQLEPMSNPTIDFPDPNIPTILPYASLSGFTPFRVLSRAGSLGCSGPFLGAVHVHCALLFHPLVQNGLLKLPAVPEFEGRDFLFGHVFVKGVRTDSQVLRSLSNVHYLTRICRHKRKPFHSWVVALYQACGGILLSSRGETSGRSELYLG